MQMTQQVGKDWFESAASFHFKTKRNELMQRRGMNVERTREPNEPNGAEPNRTEPNERNTNLRLRVAVVVVYVVCKGHDTVAFARLPLRLLRAAFVAKLFSVFLYFVFSHPQSFAANTDFLRTSLSCIGNSVRAAVCWLLAGSGREDVK